MSETQLDTYLEAMDQDGAPILGHLVMYSIYDSQVTPHALENWFRELDLDPSLVPGELRAVDAFERVTGPNGVRETYPLDDDGTPEPAPSAGRRRRRGGSSRPQATLMIRDVRRDNGEILRHVIREVRNPTEDQLSYNPLLAQCRFRHDNPAAPGAGAGTMQLIPHQAAIDALPPGEQDIVAELLDRIKESFDHHRTFLSADRLRTVIRKFVENLDATPVRPTGGVYFVPRRHAGTIGALRELVSRFGGKNKLNRVPLADQDEMRELVLDAFITKATDDLNRLALEIAEAQRAGASEGAVADLYRRFRQVQAATADHAELLNTSLDDTDSALQLVQAQLASLMTKTDD